MWSTFMKRKIYVLGLILLLINSGFSVYSLSSESTSLFESSIPFADLVDLIDHDRVIEFHAILMSFGPRYTGSENCSNAGDWIHSAFHSMGLHVSFHEWDFDGFTSRNIVATIPGTQEDSSIEYLLTAHYDCTSGSLGADDDGSGIAAILSIAEVLSNSSFPYTIRFIAFSGEEVGTYGSFSYARDAYRRGDNIRAIINPDMIGYADTSKGGRTLRFFYPVGSKWIATSAQEIAERYNQLIDMKIDALPNYIGADHQPFVDYGYDGVWVAHQDGYQWANTPEDDPEHLNFSYLTKATKLLLAVIAEFASTQVPVSVRFVEPYEGYAYINDKPIIPLDCGKLWYWGLRGMTVLVGPAKATAIIESTQEIEYVIFCTDNNFVFWDSSPPYEWNIQGKHFPLIGRHKIQVYVYTTEDVTDSDEMEIFSISNKCQYN